MDSETSALDKSLGIIMSGFRGWSSCMIPRIFSTNGSQSWAVPDGNDTFSFRANAFHQCNNSWSQSEFWNTVCTCSIRFHAGNFCTIIAGFALISRGTFLHTYRAYKSSTDFYNSAVFDLLRIKVGWCHLVLWIRVPSRFLYGDKVTSNTRCMICWLIMVLIGTAIRRARSSPNGLAHLRLVLMTCLDNDTRYSLKSWYPVVLNRPCRWISMHVLRYLG